MWLEFKECTEKAVVTLQTPTDSSRLWKRKQESEQCRQEAEPHCKQCALIDIVMKSHEIVTKTHILDKYQNEILIAPERSVANKHASNITKAKYEITTGT